MASSPFAGISATSTSESNQGTSENVGAENDTTQNESAAGGEGTTGTTEDSKTNADSTSSDSTTVDKDAEIAQLKAQLAAKDSTLSNLQAQANELVAAKAKADSERRYYLSSLPVARYQIAGYEFKNGYLSLDADEFAAFKTMLATQPLEEQMRISLLPAGQIPEGVVGLGVTGIDTTANSILDGVRI